MVNSAFRNNIIELKIVVRLLQFLRCSIFIRKRKYQFHSFMQKNPNSTSCVFQNYLSYGSTAKEKVKI